MAGAALRMDDVRQLQTLLRDRLIRTPVVRCAGLEAQYANYTEIYTKLEFLQHTGTF